MRILFLLCFALCSDALLDWRELSAGRLIVRDMYLDQPYCLVSNGSWACTLTRSSIGRESGAGIHVEAWFSVDDGSSWRASNLDVSNTTSYSAIVRTAYGRYYVLFGWHHSSHSGLPPCTFGYRASDDGGLTWSPPPAAAPFNASVRHTSIDGGNGSWVDMWTVDRFTTTAGGAALLAFTKYSGPMVGPEEVFVLASPDLLTERDAAAVTWLTLPAGPTGLPPPGGNPGIMEEGHVVPLAGSPGCFALARTAQGFLAAAATADPTCAGGWGQTGFARFWSATPVLTNRALKNPRGPVQLRRMAGGRYLLLFYYNSNLDFSSRNPYFIAAGREEGGEVRFSQPEVALYDFWDLADKPGYPDLVEDDIRGSVFVTETNKTDARIHALPAPMLALLYAQDVIAVAATTGIAHTFGATAVNTTLPSPPLPDFGAGYPAEGYGATVGLWLCDHFLVRGSGEVLIDTRDHVTNAGLRIATTDATPALRALNVTLTDVAGGAVSLVTDPPCTGLLSSAGAPHYFAAVVDAGAHMLSVFVDGVLCDGGSWAAQGWAWVPPTFGNATGRGSFVLAPNYSGKVLGGVFYERWLYTSELVGNYRAGPPAAGAACRAQ